MSILSGKVVLTLVALTTACGPYLADWNKTHVFNERWPPHAKFHNGQTMSFGAALGLATLWYLWSAASSGVETHSPSAHLSLTRQRLRFATLLAALYWITQWSAVLYPGSLCVDPEFGDGCPQHILDGVLLSVTGLGWILVEMGLHDQQARGEKGGKRGGKKT